MLVNPGGPGGEGLVYSARMKERLPAGVARTYDLIGFDPRGVGASRPAMSCIDDYAKGPRPDYEPTTGAAGPVSTPEKQWLARSKKYADACAAATPYLIKRMRTVDAVRDLELLRRALGAPKLNFYGYSYGTYLAQVYATLYPARVRRFVLDGVVDPRHVWYTAQLNQDKGFEKAIGAFFTWTAKHHSTYRLGDTAGKVATRFYAEQDELRGSPRNGIGPAEFTDAFLPGGYSQGWWPTLATALRRWVNGDTGLVRAIYADQADIGDDNGFAVYNGVQCTDTVWPRDYATWRRDAFATAAVAPFETWGNVWYNTPCIYWKAPQGLPVDIRTQGIRALIVSTSLDGATPYAGALELRKRWTRSILVGEIGNTTHTAGLDGYRCVDSRILSYLRTGKLPARVSGTRADVRCPARPQPTP
jgi:pimeloyl-ACP methyl ester carboxylesterase